MQLAFQDLKNGIELDSEWSADNVEKHFNTLFKAVLEFQNLQAPAMLSLHDGVRIIDHNMAWVLCTRKKGSQSIRVCSNRPDGALLKHVKDTSEKATWKDSKIFLGI